MSEAADALMGIFGFKRVECAMKTDRELLELAAKAAGINLWWDGESPKELVHHWSGNPEDGGEERDYPWNPLTDDGDALRLVVKLRIDLEWREDGRIAAYRHAHADGHCFTAIESSREDCAAAARRAIVRAAAAIGEGMQ